MASSRRRAILEEMLRAVGTSGYEDVSMGVVLGRSGASKRAFELEFEGKEDCYLAAFELGVGALELRLGHAMRGERDWLGRLRVGLDALLDYLDAEPAVARALFVEVHEAGPEGQRVWEEAMRRAAESIDLARYDPAAQSSPPPIAPRAIVAGLYGMLRAQLAAKASGTLRELMPDLTYLAVVQYFGEEAARREMLRAMRRLHDWQVERV